MGMAHTARNTAQDTAGKAQEKLGELMDNDELKHDGQTDQAEAKAKEAAENVKDTFKK